MSDFRDMYKNANQLKEHQTARRMRLLEEQKRQRKDQFSFQRDLKEIVLGKNNRKQHRLNNMFRYNLMLSEWMMSKPDDIEDFLLIPCPKGIRCSLSTGENNKKSAKLYYKNGLKFLEMKTNLPAFTILDCIFCEKSKTIFILDVTVFNNRDLITCDATFRFFWLKSKFLEDDLKILDNDINFKLKVLENYDFIDTCAINFCFGNLPEFTEETELDGFLFYHKEGSYTPGEESPLVLWLFPFMIFELFDNYKVNQIYHSKRPETYSNYLDFIKEFDEKSKKRKKKKLRDSSGMDFESTEARDSVIEDEVDVTQDMIDLEEFGNDV